MKHNIWHIIILILVTVSAKIGAQDANNVTWKISWQANYGQYENLFRSYDIKCGCDIDRDGKGEILLNDGVTTKFLLLEAVQNDSFNVIWTIERPHQSTLRSLAVTDWDLDSLQEVSVIMDSPVGELPGAVYEWTGADNGLPTADAPTAEFDLPRNTDNAVCVEASSVLANLDGDPGPEWILPYFRGSGVSLVILELSTAVLRIMVGILICSIRLKARCGLSKPATWMVTALWRLLALIAAPKSANLQKHRH